MNLRGLTESGIEQFRAYLNQLRDQPATDPPTWLLTDATGSEPVAEVPVIQREFASRLDAAQYLDTLFQQAELTNVERNVGLWSWLTLYYFDQLCTAGSNRQRKVKEIQRYLPAVNDFQKYYRHLLLGPYTILQAHREHIDEAAALLCGPVNTISDIIEQLASRREWVTNRGVVATATKLYVNGSTGTFKRGAGGKGDGSPRRLHEILDQFDLTFDLYGMDRESIVALLPSEFSKFLK